MEVLIKMLVKIQDGRCVHHYNTLCNCLETEWMRNAMKLQSALYDHSNYFKIPNDCCLGQNLRFWDLTPILFATRYILIKWMLRSDRPFWSLFSAQTSVFFRECLIRKLTFEYMIVIPQFLTQCSHTRFLPMYCILLENWYSHCIKMLVKWQFLTIYKDQFA